MSSRKIVLLYAHIIHARAQDFLYSISSFRCVSKKHVFFFRYPFTIFILQQLLVKFVVVLNGEFSTKLV